MIRLFISYAHVDEQLRQELDKHLMSLKHKGIIETWHDRRIDAGRDWEEEINEHLRSAEVILLLISSDFIASNYCYGIELDEAMRRHSAHEAVVIPVILRPCDWHDLPFGKLQAATKEGKPVTKFSTLDDGFLEVVQAVKAVVQRIGGASNRFTSPTLDSLANILLKPKSTLVAEKPRSSNLSVKKTFNDHDRNTFCVQAFEYISDYFETSLAELTQRNPQLKTHFRLRDANSFEAIIYEDGKESARCGIWLQNNRRDGEINYSSSGLGSGNSYNESLSVVDDMYTLGLKAMGFGAFVEGHDKQVFTFEGAAEYLWTMLIEKVQR